MSIELNRKQVIQLLNFFGGDEGGVTIEGTSVGHSGPGLYVYCTDYESEGKVFLDPNAIVQIEPWRRGPKTEPPREINYGKIAYNAYCKSSGGVSLVSGAKLPEWESLDDKIRTAWECAAESVLGMQLMGSPDAT